MQNQRSNLFEKSPLGIDFSNRQINAKFIKKDVYSYDIIEV